MRNNPLIARDCDLVKSERTFFEILHFRPYPSNFTPRRSHSKLGNIVETFMFKYGTINYFEYISASYINVNLLTIMKDTYSVLASLSSNDSTDTSSRITSLPFFGGAQPGGGVK